MGYEARVFSVMEMFFSRPASQFKYMGPLKELRCRLPVEPGAFWKKT